MEAPRGPRHFGSPPVPLRSCFSRNPRYLDTTDNINTFSSRGSIIDNLYGTETVATEGLLENLASPLHRISGLQSLSESWTNEQDPTGALQKSQLTGLPGVYSRTHNYHIRNDQSVNSSFNEEITPKSTNLSDLSSLTLPIMSRMNINIETATQPDVQNLPLLRNISRDGVQDFSQDSTETTEICLVPPAQGDATKSYHTEQRFSARMSVSNQDYLTDTTTADGAGFEDDAFEDEDIACRTRTFKKVRFRAVTNDSIYEYEKYDWTFDSCDNFIDSFQVTNAAYDSSSTPTGTLIADLGQGTFVDSVPNPKTFASAQGTVPLTIPCIGRTNRENFSRQERRDNDNQGTGEIIDTMLEDIGSDSEHGLLSDVFIAPRVSNGTPSLRTRECTPHPIRNKILGSGSQSWSDESSPFFPEDWGLFEQNLPEKKELTRAS